MSILKTTCPKCKFIWEMVTKERANRSNPQNAYLWGVVYKIISEHTGFSVDEVHEFCKLEFNSKMVHIGKDEVKIGLSTAIMNTLEFTEYIEKIVMFASGDLGLNIPKPNEED